jgi:hemoglobin-like flavoprotein
MTPEQLDLVRATAPDVDALASSFAVRLRAAFPDEPVAQCHEFISELSLLAATVSDLPAFVRRARGLGATHRRCGVRARHYEQVEQLLFAVLADALGPAWDEPTMLAWRRLFRLITETMLEGSAGPAFAG